MCVCVCASFSGTMRLHFNCFLQGLLQLQKPCLLSLLWFWVIYCTSKFSLKSSSYILIILINVCGVAKSCAVEHLDQMHILAVYVSHPYSNWNKWRLWAFPKTLCVCLCVKESVKEGVKLIFTVPPPPSLQGIVFLRFTSPCCLTMSFFWVTEEAFFMISPQTAKGKVVTPVSHWPYFLQACTWS